MSLFESQQSSEPLEKKPAITRESMERNAKRQSLSLSRQRVARELETARSEVHRTALKNALDYLAAELAKL